MKKFLMILGVLAIVAMLAVADDTPRGPVIVARVAIIGNTSSIGSTNLFTPSSDGEYEMSCYIIGNQLGGGAQEVDFQWTDEIGTQSAECSVVSSGSGNSNRAITYIHATSGNPIKYSAPISSYVSPASFNVFITVVKE